MQIVGFAVNPKVYWQQTSIHTIYDIWPCFDDARLSTDNRFLTFRWVCIQATGLRSVTV